MIPSTEVPDDGGTAMMGERQGRQERLFYAFCLEDRVPADHLLRRIDAVLDLGWLRSELTPFYSHTGRPSVDPELMIRMLIVGYCYSIRSERRLCREVDLNLAYRWFCRLSLEDAVPDHSTFSVNRHGRVRASAAFRRIFEKVVHACMKAGLVGGEGFAVDASVIEADASRFNRVTGGAAIDWTDEQRARRPITEYLTDLDSETLPTNPARAPKAISPVDLCAAWTTRGRFKAAFAYSFNCLIDLKEAVIVDVAATPTRISKEVDATETMLERSVNRDVHEDARDYTCSLMESPAYRKSTRERKKIEHRFAETKTTMGLTRLRLRGLTGADDEFLLAAIVQNLKRLAKAPRPTVAGMASAWFA